MGRDKAMLALDRIPLWERQVIMLQAAGAVTVGVVRRPGMPSLALPANVPLWQDVVPGAGPLAGLDAALAACPTAWLAVVATDMPRLDASWFQWLAGHAAPDHGAVVQHADGTFEPLAAIYPKAAQSEVKQRLCSADHSLQGLIYALVVQRRLVVLSLTDADVSRVENWNTPEQLREGG
jgi:molybdenum cofactor guanylyltransferase